MEIARARWELELDNAMHGDEDRRRELRASKGLKTPLTPAERTGLKRRGELERFLATATDEAMLLRARRGGKS